jgi:tRNA-Thr(GGU) m(6)t(6)A37 methyltransferase TsaA
MTQPTSDRATEALEVRAIGVARTPFVEKADAPRQPRAASGAKGTIELLPGRGFEDAVRDLDVWSHVWVLFWFHESSGWAPTVLPPRSTKKRGLFATRAPRRPNPIGMSVLGLDRVEGLVLHVSDIDLLDGTPILDIKPYVAWTDAIPDARGGWLGPLTASEGEVRPEDPQPDFTVTFTPRAHTELEFLRERGLDLEPRIEDILALGPQPHAYRRIRVEGDGYRLYVKEWRVRFTAKGRHIEVVSISTGVRPSELFSRPDEPALALHHAFVARFGMDG